MSNIANALKIERPDDIAKLKANIPLLQGFSYLEVERLYDRFSDTYSAQWLILSDETIADFEKWLDN